MDVALYPLDTLKTRIQSEQGLWKAGGFRQIYKGIGPIAVGSAPCGKLTSIALHCLFPKVCRSFYIDTSRYLKLARKK